MVHGGRMMSIAVALLMGAVLAPAGATAQEAAPARESDPCTEPCRRPDARIRRANERVAIGNGIYNWDGLGQTRVAVIGRGTTTRFVVRLENDGSVPDDLVVQGARNTRHFGIRYFVEGRQVSARVRAGVLRFNAVGPGRHRALTVEVKAKRSAPLRSRVIARVAVRSDTQPGQRDRVKAVVYRSQGIETRIEGRAFASRATAQRWARQQGASARFVRNAHLYWQLAPSRGVRADVAYAQSAKETAYGNFGGVITASWNNPCGLKITAGGGNDDPNAHKRFASWRQGVIACIDHLGLYAGAPSYPRANSPDPRHFPSIYATAPTVERLGGRWAPAPGYGRSIVRSYLLPMLGA